MNYSKLTKAELIAELKSLQSPHLSKPVSKKMWKIPLEIHAQILEKMAEGVKVIDENGIIIFTNPACDKYFGYEREELLGKHVSIIDANISEKQAIIIEEITDQIKKFGSWAGEFKDVRKDGKLLNTLSKITTFEVSDKTYWISVQQDITKSKQIEQKLVQSQERLTLAIDATNGGLWDQKLNPDASFDDQPDKIYLSPWKENILGYENGDLHNSLKAWSKCVLPEDRAQRIENQRDHFENRSDVLDHEYRVRCKDGEIKWIYGRSRIIRDEQGLPIRWVGIDWDITERKQAEENLKVSEKHFKTLFNLAPDAYYINDFLGNFIDGNAAAEKLTGYKKEELIGKNFLKLSLLAKRDVPRAAAVLARNLLGKSTGPDEFVLNRKDGSQVTVEILAVPVKIDGKNVVLGIARNITEQKLAENALKESEDRLHSVLEKMPDGVGVSVQDKITYSNPAMTEITGFKKREIMGKSPQDFLHPEDQRLAVSRIKEIFNGGPEYPTEYRLIKKNGNPVYVEIFSRMIKFDGKTGLLSIIRDITERKNAENKIIESEEKYRAIFENVHDVFYITDYKGSLTEVSPSVEKYSGYTREELIGKPLLQFYAAPDDYVNLCKTLDEKGEVTDFEIRMKNKKDQLVYVSVNARLLYDSDNNPIGSEGLVRDITKRKKMETKLQISYEYLDSILLNLPIGFAILEGPEFRYFRINHVLAEMNGLPIEDHLGRRLAEVLPDGSEDIIPGLREVLETGAPSPKREFSTRLPGDPNKTRHFIGSCFPITGIDGKPKAVGAVVLDITERKETEDRLKEALAEKDVLLKEIHHRVKNNLQVISSLLELKSGFIKSEKVRELFQESQNQIKSISLVHEHLYQSGDLEKIDFGNYVHSLIEQLIYSYGWKLENMSLKINIDKLMEVDQSIHCGLIINEIASNSLKHAFKEKSNPEIRIELHSRKGDLLTLIVGDNGLGFPQELDFRRTNSLGFQLIQALVKQLHGTIEMRRNGGTEFKITFDTKTF